MEQVVWETEEGATGGVFLEMELRLTRGGIWGIRCVGKGGWETGCVQRGYGIRCVGEGVGRLGVFRGDVGLGVLERGLED